MRSAHPINNLLLKPTYLVIAISGAIIFLALFILVTTSWHSLRLVKPVQEHLKAPSILFRYFSGDLYNAESI